MRVKLPAACIRSDSVFMRVRRSSRAKPKSKAKAVAAPSRGRVVRPICWLLRHSDKPVGRLALPVVFLSWFTRPCVGQALAKTK